MGVWWGHVKHIPVMHAPAMPMHCKAKAHKGHPQSWPKLCPPTFWLTLPACTSVRPQHSLRIIC